MTLGKSWYSIEETAIMLGCSDSDVEQYLQTGQLHAAVRVVQFVSLDEVSDPEGVPDPACPIGLPPQKLVNLVKCNNGFFEIDDYNKIDWNENGSFNLFNVTGRLFEIAEPEKIIAKIYPKVRTVYRPELVITTKELNSATGPSDKLTATSKDNPRVIDGLLIMVIAMAMKGYRYKPGERSETVNEIMRDIESLGLSLSENTIRKRLKKAAELLPRDEKL